MSRIGRLPITVPAGVTVTVDGRAVNVKGPKGELSLNVAAPIEVTEGYSKGLEIVGTGYRVAAKGESLEFALGYSHPITFDPPKGISFEVEGNTKVTVRGIDKQAVGEVAANIRKLRKPEPYKGKGVRYAGEVVRRKAGKSGK